MSSLTNAGLAVGVQGVFLVAATHWSCVCVVTRVLAASVSIITCYLAHIQTSSCYCPKLEQVLIR